jgi:hypothetical protein
MPQYQMKVTQYQSSPGKKTPSSVGVLCDATGTVLHKLMYLRVQKHGMVVAPQLTTRMNNLFT